ncbi:helix-hairpin-helix domain-containing protein [Amycolatopsis sp. cmx-4-68]|uniref:helix-hairpin-helix domain-containing protein n=1 Tax=Amycolatopsis sp. cmx-4-68 TaxID=2790938 RepID=UPI00397B0861
MSEELLKLANIGPAMVRDLARLGITEPAQPGFRGVRVAEPPARGEAPDVTAGRDPLELYERLCAADDQRHDPCVLDTFMSAVDQADGAPPRPWWTYTPERKRLLGTR